MCTISTRSPVSSPNSLSKHLSRLSPGFNPPPGNPHGLLPRYVCLSKRMRPCSSRISALTPTTNFGLNHQIIAVRALPRIGNFPHNHTSQSCIPFTTHHYPPHPITLPLRFTHR